MSRDLTPPQLTVDTLKGMTISEVNTERQKYVGSMRLLDTPQKEKAWSDANFNALLLALPDIMENSLRRGTTLSFSAPPVEYPSRLACLRFMIERASDDPIKNEALARKIKELKKPDGSPYTFNELALQMGTGDSSEEDFFRVLLTKCLSWKTVHAILEIPYAAGSTETIGEKYNNVAINYLFVYGNFKLTITPEAKPAIDLLLKSYVKKHPEVLSSADNLEAFLKHMRIPTDSKLFISKQLLEIERSADMSAGMRVTQATLPSEAHPWYILAGNGLITFADAYRKTGVLPLKFADVFKVYKDLSADEKRIFLSTHKAALETFFLRACLRYEEDTIDGAGFYCLEPEKYITEDKAEWKALIDIFRSVLPASEALPHARSWLENCDAFTAQPEAAAAQHPGFFGRVRQFFSHDANDHTQKDDEMTPK